MTIVAPQWQPIFYSVGGLALLIFALATWDRLSIWQQGRDEAGSPMAGLSIMGLLRLSFLKLFSPDCLLARRVFARSRVRGLMLLSIIWGAIILLGGVLVSAVSFTFNWPIPGGQVGLVFSLLLDLGGGLLLAGLLTALGRRYLFRPERWVAVTADGLLLTLFTLVVILGFVMEGVRLAPLGWEGMSRWPVGTLFGLLLALLVGGRTAVLAAAYPGLYLLHAGLALALMAYIPFSKLFHILAAQIVTYAATRELEAGRSGIT